ncbi:MAG: protein kinase [Gemmatimonadaceae bacterium]|nr:protein kinase [Gemmatimonadaceae bacterium]
MGVAIFGAMSPEPREIPEVATLFGELAELSAAERGARLRTLDSEAPEVARELRALLDVDADRHDFLGLFTFALTGTIRPLGASGSDAGSNAGGDADHASAADAANNAVAPATWITPLPVRSIAPAMQIGPYRLTREIGRGGMGSVWLARDQRLARDVALKFLPGTASTGDSGGERSTRALQRTRFLVEARAAAAIDHPHVASVFDFGADANGQLFIAMAYCAGGSLAHRLRNGPISVDESVEIATQVASALYAAHQQGVVHRDVKPANVLFDAWGRVRLADFGIASLPGHEATRTGSVQGTLGYLAPEQMRGERADAAADLWALGVTMYECLSGQRPFVGDSMASVMHAVLHTDPLSIAMHVPRIPAALAALVHQLLDKDPRRRPASALAVEQALREGRALAPSVPLRAWPTFATPPAQLTSFLGRSRDVEAVLARVRTDRLVTLTGAGGSGKTRLASAVASRFLEDKVFGDGRTAWVDLTSIAENAQVATQVAAALRAPERADGKRLEAIVAAIGDAPMLLVVDNCEHVLDGVTVMLEAVLAACPRLHVLATSRELLALGVEHAWLTPGLDVGDARALFVQRARAALATFELTTTMEPVVDEICRRLDGMPLAIELAAARVRAMPVDLIRDRLTDMFQLLSSGSRTALPRQRTLRGMMEWSHGLLDLRDRIVLRRLAVFSGGFRLDLAGDIAGGVPDVQGDDADVWPNLTSEDVQESVLSLVDKSLVVLYHSREIPRYRLLETVRQYATERLVEANEYALARERHARTYLALAEEMSPKFIGGEHTPGLMARLISENDNLRTAARWTVEESDGPIDRAEMALRFSASMFWYWHSSAAWLGTAQYGEVSAFVETTLARSGDSPTQLRADALVTLGLLGLACGEWDRSAAALTDARQLRMDGNDALAQVWVDAWYSAVCLMRGKVQEGWTIVDAAWRDLAGAPPSIVHTVTTSWRGLIAQVRGDLVTAREMQEMNCRYGYEIGHTTSSAHAEAFLGMINLTEGRVDEAEQNFRRSFPMHFELLDGWGLALDLDGMCGVSLARGRFVHAARLMGAVDAWRTRIGIAMPAFAAPARQHGETLTREALGVVFSTAYDEGRAMSPDMAIAGAFS